MPRTGAVIPLCIATAILCSRMGRWGSPESFDHELRSIISALLNISLDEDSAWSQATLPVGLEGTGVRRAVQLAPLAFLASTAGCDHLINRINKINKMNDDVVKVAVGLRQGVPLRCTHDCNLCGAGVDELATHVLSCSKSQSRHSCHTAINELIQ